MLLLLVEQLTMATLAITDYGCPLKLVWQTTALLQKWITAIPMLPEPIIHYGPGAESSLNTQRILSHWDPSRIFRSIGGII